ncbi:filamentous hemagglutinin N-terminal domain-containing protein [Candidatus Halobeggiatoa sp. HSG11]|nr:filamentous hemagglutinin N-terminal domain-containing protein [Candidatus Halobeggiatoa sp. HSG11]
MLSASVTGGDVSNIDGTFSSNMSNADFYFLNPAGILFGANAQLDIQGSLYLSSADYLHFEDGLQFNTNITNQNSLTVAEPSAFGFLDKHFGNITINGSSNSSLRVAEEKNLVIVGGDIQINSGDLYAPRGNIKLVSSLSKGEVKPLDIMNNTLTQLGNIKLEKRTSLDVNAQTAEQGKSGSIFILGGQFFLTEQSYIQTLGDAGTGDITIISKGQLQISDNSQITMKTSGDVDIGNITIKANHLKVTDGSQIRANGKSGTITINAEKIGSPEQSSDV